MGDDQAAPAKPHQNLVVIPVIPRPLAIFCLVANIIVPGSGNAHLILFLCVKLRFDIRIRTAQTILLDNEKIII
jgi:hypothetical protein